MGRKTSNLGYQLTSAITACTYDGHSKREYKQAHGGDTGYRVFGITYKSDLCETAKDLGRFLHAGYPEVKLVRDITPAMVQAYLDHKAATCRPATMDKIFAHLRKIDRVICHKYKAPGYSDGISMPDVSNADKLRDKAFNDDDFKLLRDSLAKSRGGSGRAVVLSRYAGLRVEEASSVRVERFSRTGGRWGYGTLDILKGDGSKGNRPRHIDIPTAEARDAIAEAVSGRQPGQYIVCKADGSAYDKRSITRAISRHMDRLGIGNEYKQNKSHALRKTFAQECYDLSRRAGDSRQEALAYVNRQLGHGDSRRDLSDTYVLNQW